MIGGRRRFLSRTAATAATAALPCIGWPAASSDVKRVAIVYPGTRKATEERFADFRKAMREFGYDEKNLAVEFHGVEHDSGSWPRVAAELVRAKPDVIVAESTEMTRLLQERTRSIPIVTGVGDPVGAGFARTLFAPGGNITGLSWGNPESAHQRLRLMRAFLPRLSTLFVLISASNRAARDLTDPLEAAARENGVTSAAVLVAANSDVEKVLHTKRPDGTSAVFVEGTLQKPGADAEGDVKLVADLALRVRMPLFAHWAIWPQQGALASQANVHRNRLQSIASLVASILRGAKPAAMPFVLPESVEIVVNRRTAAALKLPIPQEVLLLATQLIG